VQVLQTVLTALALVVAVGFAALVFLTGKGDAMSGGSSVRTSFKGKATVDDIMAKITLSLGVGFMALMLVINILAENAR
jgi:preprotein translocase subunit SecG